MTAPDPNERTRPPPMLTAAGFVIEPTSGGRIIERLTAVKPWPGIR